MKNIKYFFMKKLQGKELYRRLQEAGNARKLLVSARQRIKDLERLVQRQATIIEQQQQQLVFQQQLIEKQTLRIEYLEKIVFGKSRNKKNSDNEKGDGGKSGNKERKPRDSKSYQRDIPRDAEITETNSYPLGCCPDCHGPLTEVKTILRYVEDVVLPDEVKNPLKSVEKQLIESGWCQQCQGQKSAMPINGSRVLIGKNARIMTVYLSVVMRLSYEQIRNMMRDIYYLKLSDGEIENILEEQGNRLSAEHQKIAASLIKQGAHYDETIWKTVKTGEGDYCWIKTGIANTDTIFLFGKSRGKGNAKKLSGKSEQVGITDDYAGYSGLFRDQQLCWAHPYRKLRDLVESKAITGQARENCKKTYEQFGKLYRELRESTETFASKQAKKAEYLLRFTALTGSEPDDPAKLKVYKKTLQKKREKYFTFFDLEGTPMDNNQAERRLRHVVLKRKISQGSKTGKGAAMLEKLYSVVLSWWWKDPVNFIVNYRHLLS